MDPLRQFREEQGILNWSTPEDVAATVRGMAQEWIRGEALGARDPPLNLGVLLGLAQGCRVSEVLETLRTARSRDELFEELRRERDRMEARLQAYLEAAALRQRQAYPEQPPPPPPGPALSRAASRARLTPGPSSGRTPLAVDVSSGSSAAWGEHPDDATPPAPPRWAPGGPVDPLYEASRLSPWSGTAAPTRPSSAAGPRARGSVEAEVRAGGGKGVTYSRNPFSDYRLAEPTGKGQDQGRGGKRRRSPSGPGARGGGAAAQGTAAWPVARPLTRAPLPGTWPGSQRTRPAQPAHPPARPPPRPQPPSGRPPAAAGHPRGPPAGEGRPPQVPASQEELGFEHRLYGEGNPTLSILD